MLHIVFSFLYIFCIFHFILVIHFNTILNCCVNIVVFILIISFIQIDFYNANQEIICNNIVLFLRQIW